jgi:choline kinase
VIEAVILAAGRGSRLQELTADRPKPMVKVGGTTLVQRAVRSLYRAGVGPVKLVVGYRAEALRFLGLPFIDNPEWAETGIFWSLSHAAPTLSAAPAIVCYGDIFFETADVARLVEEPGDIVVGYDPAALALWSQRFADPFVDLENFAVDAAGRCTRIGGRLERGERLDGQFTGLFKLTPRGWADLCRTADALPLAKRRVVDMTSLLALAIVDGIALRAMPLQGKWGEVDEPSDITLYERLYFQASG